MPDFTPQIKNNMEHCGRLQGSYLASVRKIKSISFKATKRFYNQKNMIVLYQ